MLVINVYNLIVWYNKIELLIQNLGFWNKGFLFQYGIFLTILI